MHSSGSPRHAGSSAAPSGIILAPGSASAAVLPSRSFQTSSAAADCPPEATGSPGLCPDYSESRLVSEKLRLLSKTLRWKILLAQRVGCSYQATRGAWQALCFIGQALNAVV